MILYKITKATTDGTELTIIANCGGQIGTRKDEFGNIIPIMNCRDISVVILIEDLPETGKLGYIKLQTEATYDALPDESVVKQLIGKTWSS